MKAVTSHTLFIIAVVVIALIVVIFLFFNFISFFEPDVTEEACIAKLTQYCFEWRLKGLDPSNPPLPEWEDRWPENCDQFGIRKPTAEQCK